MHCNGEIAESWMAEWEKKTPERGRRYRKKNDIRKWSFPSAQYFSIIPLILCAITASEPKSYFAIQHFVRVACMHTFARGPPEIVAWLCIGLRQLCAFLFFAPNRRNGRECGERAVKEESKSEQRKKNENNSVWVRGREQMMWIEVRMQAASAVAATVTATAVRWLENRV